MSKSNQYENIKHNLVVISGAISNHHVDSPVTKLRGRPLVLTRDGEVLKFSAEHEPGLVRHLKRVMRRKVDLLRSLLNELEIGMRTSRSSTTLRPEYIIDYVHREGTRPVLVVWNGSSDVDILRRLGVGCPMVVNLTAYDQRGDQRYTLKLINYGNGALICARDIGWFDKNGRMLSLSEAHSIVCPVHHDITYLHDPAVDVLYTKCVFNHLVRLEGYGNVLARVVDQYD